MTNAPRRAAQASHEPPRARGTARVSSKLLGARSVLDGLTHSGSLKLVFPRVAEHALQAVTVNTAGGVTGGDRFALDVRAGAGTALTLTTQAAERAYRARPGDAAGRVETRLVVEDGAILSWLPQETILFDGCAFSRRLCVELASAGRFLMVEPLILGRAAMGEVVRTGFLDDRIEISRSGSPLYLDRIILDGDMAARMARPAQGGGAGAFASVIFVDPRASVHLEPLRAMLDGVTGGVSLLHEDVLVMRLVAPDGHLLRQALIPALTRLNGTPLPRPWMI